MNKKQGLIILLLLLGGGLLLGSGVWIHVKAGLAQVLLRHAWARTVDLDHPVKAWPWADTWPVARLSSLKYDQDLIVLSGQAGATLAFGPGMLIRGAGPGEKGTCVLAGHRDTSFRFLEQVEVGDIFTLEDSRGVQWKYRVVSVAVRQAEDLYFRQPSNACLALVTCYPFAAVLPGTPQRFVVEAEMI